MHASGIEERSKEHGIPVLKDATSADMDKRNQSF